MGLNLRKNIKFPEAIIDFITSHHGTMKMEYFYKKAIEQAGDEPNVNEMDFRYPGPLPISKEAGIVMICEGIEAATRSIKEKTLNRISDMVDSIIKTRLDDGQLNECDLTLAEIGKIKEAILPILIGMYHVRVEYPDDTDENKSDKKAKDTEVKQPDGEENEKIKQINAQST